MGGLVGLMANPSPNQIKKQSTKTQPNPTFNPRYSTQAQPNLIFLNLGWTWVDRVELKLIGLDSGWSGWLGCMIQNLFIVVFNFFFSIYLYQNLNKK